MRVFVVLVALAVAAGAQQADPSRHDKYANDPQAYCLPGPPEKGDTHGHECHCKLECMNGPNGPEQAETPACEMYCTKTRCGCWPEDGCAPQDEKPDGR